jgi:hypothetical protein
MLEWVGSTLPAKRKSSRGITSKQPRLSMNGIVDPLRASNTFSLFHSGGATRGATMRFRAIFLTLAAMLLGLLSVPGDARAQLPPSKNAPKIGDRARDFTLPDSTGKRVKLSSLRFGEPEITGATAEIRGYWVLLIFYRGYW